MTQRRTVLPTACLALAALGIVLTGCASSAGAQPSGAQPSEELSIYAAASLTDAFTELADDFAAANPDVDVRPVVFDGSSTLATQIAEGAPADVFASADVATMRRLGDDAASVRLFASNTLTLAVAPGNPAHVAELGDLARADVSTVLCAPEVPCGAVSHRLLEARELQVEPVSEEQNVKAVLTKVELGQADAGLVYLTDVEAAGDAVDHVRIDAAEVATRYPIARVVGGAQNRSAESGPAESFIEFVLSDRGQAVLADYGFGRP